MGLVGFYIGALRPEPTVTLVHGSPVSLTISWFRAPLGSPKAADAVISIADPSELQKLERQLNMLKPLPQSGTRVCGFDDGSRYELLFLYQNGDRATIQIGAKGCQDISAYGVVEATAANTDLITELRRLVPQSA